MIGGMMLFWALLLIVLFVGLFRLVPRRSSPSAGDRLTPLERLQHRYARGEISTEAYEQRRRRLDRT
jgi:putative membrane protein